MQIYVLRNGQQYGPYSLEDVQGYLASGNMRPQDLAWHEGAADWTPLSTIPGMVAASAAAAISSPPVVPVNPPLATATGPGQKVKVALNDGRTVEIDAAQFKALKQKAGLKTMGYGALWFFGGLIVTGVSYAMASSNSGGGTYVVTWGAVIIGGIQIVRGLIQYLRA